MGNSLLGRQENEAWGASLRRGSIKETAILTEQKRGQLWENIRRRHSSQGKGCCCWLLDASTYRISLAFSYNGCRFSRIADEACQELLYCASWEDNSWLNLPILSEHIPLLEKGTLEERTCACDQTSIVIDDWQLELGNIQCLNNAT